MHLHTTNSIWPRKKILDVCRWTDVRVWACSWDVCNPLRVWCAQVSPQFDRAWTKVGAPFEWFESLLRTNESFTQTYYPVECIEYFKKKKNFNRKICVEFCRWFSFFAGDFSLSSSSSKAIKPSHSTFQLSFWEKCKSAFKREH